MEERVSFHFLSDSLALVLPLLDFLLDLLHSYILSLTPVDLAALALKNLRPLKAEGILLQAWMSTGALEQKY